MLHSSGLLRVQHYQSLCTFTKGYRNASSEGESGHEFSPFHVILYIMLHYLKSPRRARLPTFPKRSPTPLAHVLVVGRVFLKKRKKRKEGKRGKRRKERGRKEEKKEKRLLDILNKLDRPIFSELIEHCFMAAMFFSQQVQR